MPADGQVNHTATLGGRVVHLVSQQGAGPPILLLSGCAVPSYDWDLVAELLPDLALLRLDRPGLLGSPWPGLLPRLADEVATLEALLVTVGPAVVVAHSMAGFHAEALGRKRPDLVAGLVLADGSVEWASRRPRHRRGWLWLATFVRRAMVANVLAEQAAYAEQAWDLAQLRESSRWPAIPTIVLSAAAGRGARWIADQACLATLLNARQIVVADSRHLIMIDRPDVVAEAVRALRGTEDDHG